MNKNEVVDLIDQIVYSLGAVKIKVKKGEEVTDQLKQIKSQVTELYKKVGE